MTRGWAIAMVCCAACASGAPQPVAIDRVNDACRHCRMIVSDPRVAAQVVAPGEEPLIFDDIGCMRDHLAASASVPGAVAYVADHQTGIWVPAAAAVFTRIAASSTPMASGIIAHVDAVSRDGNAAARGGEPIDVVAILPARFLTAGGVP